MIIKLPEIWLDFSVDIKSSRTLQTTLMMLHVQYVMWGKTNLSCYVP